MRRLQWIAVLAFVWALRPISQRLQAKSRPAVSTGHGVFIFGGTEPWIDHVRQALDLIAAVSPWHLRLVQRYCPTVLLNDRRSAHGLYVPGTETCNLWLDRLYEMPVPDTAARIVLAAAMARCWRAGVMGIGQDPSRVQAACERVMWDFVGLRRRSAGVAP